MSTYPWINDASNVGGPIGYLAITSPNGLYIKDGNLQMNTGATSKIVFYDTPNAHEHAEIDATGEGTNGGNLQFYTKADGGAVGRRLCISNVGAIGIGDPASYGTEGQVLGTMGSNAPPQWVNISPPIQGLPLPVSPYTGQQLIYEHQALGNIGSLLPMIYDGNKWRPTGSATLCRWSAGNPSNQTFTSTSVTNVNVGDYATITFTPPWDGYYEIGQTCYRWELNSGIGMSTYLSATDGTANHRLFYTEDWNGPYQHWRAGVSCPIVNYLYSTKTYRFTANITYAVGNSGTINFSGTAYVKALSTFGP